MHPVELRSSSLELLHPRARGKFEMLLLRLVSDWNKGDAPCEFRVFETYRSPMRQNMLYSQNRTKAVGFRSAHQYGLAVDYVPWVNGKWTWDVPHLSWLYLRSCAEECGLLNEIPWDRNHVEHPLWIKIRAELLLQPE